MKFGLHYQLPCSGSQSPVQRYRDTISQAIYAEELGFESVWPVEQHFNPDLSILPSPMLLLAAIAERTRNLRLGIAIVLLPLSHPIRVAEDIATLDILSGGRVEFGIGRGAIPSHFAGFGVPQGESRDRFLEGIEVILKAWASPSLSHRGRFYQFDDIAVVPKPVQRPHPPIRVAANSVDTFEMMGRLGYKIFAATQVNPFPKLREFVPLYRNARAASGATSSPDDVTILCPLYVGTTREQIRSELEPSARHFITTAANLFAGSAAALEGGAERLQKVVERARRLNYDKMSELMGIFDTPEACVDRLHRVKEEFNTGRVICWFNPGGLVPHESVIRSMELFSEKVMPHF